MNLSFKKMFILADEYLKEESKKLFHPNCDTNDARKLMEKMEVIGEFLFWAMANNKKVK